MIFNDLEAWMDMANDDNPRPPDATGATGGPGKDGAVNVMDDADIERGVEKYMPRLLALLSAAPVAGVLTFDALRRANVERMPQFKDAKGRPAHSKADGSDWALSAWSNAVLGELGEAANIIKKIERGDFTLDEARADLADELADVQTYLDILAFRAGVDLGEATVSKWNRISERVGSPVRLTARPGEEKG